MDYTQPVPYTCILISFGFTIGCLLVGAALVFVLTQCTAAWCEQVSSLQTFVYYRHRETPPRHYFQVASGYSALCLSSRTPL